MWKILIYFEENVKTRLFWHSENGWIRSRFFFHFHSLIYKVEILIISIFIRTVELEGGEERSGFFSNSIHFVRFVSFIVIRVKPKYWFHSENKSFLHHHQKRDKKRWKRFFENVSAVLCEACGDDDGDDGRTSISWEVKEGDRNRM